MNLPRVTLYLGECKATRILGATAFMLGARTALRQAVSLGKEIPNLLVQSFWIFTCGTLIF